MLHIVYRQNTRLSAKFKISLSRGIVSRPNTIQCAWSADHRISLQCFPMNEVQRKYANISQMFCFRQNSDQFTARTFNDERFAEIFVADALAQTRSITNISVTDDLKLEMSRARSTARCESNFVRVAAEHGILFSRSQRLRITFVSRLQACLTMVPNSMAEGSKSACAGCRCLPVRLTQSKFTQKKRKILSEDSRDLLENERSTVLNAEPKPRLSQSNLNWEEN